MNYGVTSDLIRLRTMQPRDLPELIRGVAQARRGVERSRLLMLLDSFPEGQIVAVDTAGNLRGWALHLRVSAQAVESLRREGSSPLSLHQPAGPVLMTFDLGAPGDREPGDSLRQALEEARERLMQGLGLKRSLMWFGARATRAA